MFSEGPILLFTFRSLFKYVSSAAIVCVTPFSKSELPVYVGFGNSEATSSVVL